MNSLVTILRSTKGHSPRGLRLNADERERVMAEKKMRGPKNPEGVGLCQPRVERMGAPASILATLGYRSELQ